MQATIVISSCKQHSSNNKKFILSFEYKVINVNAVHGLYRQYQQTQIGGTGHTAKLKPNIQYIANILNECPFPICVRLHRQARKILQRSVITLPFLFILTLNIKFKISNLGKVMLPDRK